jgi:orotidine-5'-phosphate decarboxylase
MLLHNSGLKYSDWIEASARQRRTNIVVALDDPQRYEALLPKLAPFACAVKVGYPLILSLSSFDLASQLTDIAHELNLPAIMDCKLSDVGHVNEMMAERFFEAGFDAITANPLVGWEEGLKPVFKVAKRRKKGVLILVHMSHVAAAEGFGQRILGPGGKAEAQYRLFAKKAVEWGSDGLVVGATYPSKISEVRRVVKAEIPIYSPGVGAQGGRLDDAVKAGADYLIIGRLLYGAKDPAKAAADLRKRCELVKQHKTQT